MSNVLGELFGNIADAIREKTGDTATMKPAEFPSKISGIEVGGGSSGGSLPAGVYLSTLNIYRPNNYTQEFFKLNGATYAITLPYTGSGGDVQIYRYDNSAWTAVVTQTALGDMFNSQNLPVILGGVAHIVAGKNHWVFDGSTLTKKNDAPSFDNYGSYVFLWNGHLCGRLYSDGCIYIWDETTDTWAKNALIGSANTYYFPYYEGDNLYFLNSRDLYKFEGGVLNKLVKLSKSPSNSCVYNGVFYYAYRYSGSRGTVLYKYDPTANVETNLGYVLPYDAYHNLYNFDEMLIFQSGNSTNGLSNFVIHDLT